MFEQQANIVFNLEINIIIELLKSYLTVMDCKCIHPWTIFENDEVDLS